MARRRRTRPLAPRRYNERTHALPDFRGMADIGIEDPELGSIWGGLKKVGKAVGRAAKKTAKAGLKVTKKGAKLGLKVGRYTTPVGLAITAVQKRKSLGRVLKRGAKLGLKVAKYTTPIGLSVVATQALIRNRKKIGRGLKKVGKLAAKGALYTTPIGLNILAAKKIAKTFKKALGPKKPQKIRQPNGEVLDVDETAERLGVPEDAVRDAAIAANKAGDDPIARANAVDDVEQSYGLRDDALTEVAEDTHDPEGPNFYSSDPGDNESGDDEGLQNDQAEDDVEESLQDEDLEGGHVDRESGSDREIEEDEPDEPGEEEELEEEGGEEDEAAAAGMGGSFARRRSVGMRAGRARSGWGRARPVGLVLGGRRLQMHGMGGPFSFLRKGAKAVGRAGKAVGKGVAKGVVKGAKVVGKPIAKAALQVGKTALERYTGIRLGGGGGGGEQALAVTDPGGGINLKSPLVLGGAAAVVLGGIYFATRKK